MTQEQAQEIFLKIKGDGVRYAKLSAIKQKEGWLIIRQGVFHEFSNPRNEIVLITESEAIERGKIIAKIKNGKVIK